MTQSKTREYDALRAIGAILGDFSPEDTYIGKAFEGCVEQAEENLRSDWMLSWKSRYLDEQLKNCRLSDKVEALTKTLNQKDDAIARYIDVVQGKDREISRLKGVRDETYKDLEDKLEEEHQKLEKSQAEIIRLKAKLYDVITAGKEVKK